MQINQNSDVYVLNGKKNSKCLKIWPLIILQVLKNTINLQNLNKCIIKNKIVVTMLGEIFTLYGCTFN